MRTETQEYMILETLFNVLFGNENRNVRRNRSESGKERREGEGMVSVETRSKMGGLRLCSLSFASPSSALTSCDASSMIGTEMIGTGFGRILLVELLNGLVGMRDVCGRDPLELFVGSFVAHPSDVVE